MGRWQLAACIVVLCVSTVAAQTPLAAEADPVPATIAQLSGAVQAALEEIGPQPLAPGDETRACSDCLTPHANLGYINETQVSIYADCAAGGKWYARFNGEANLNYYWDLCPNAPGSGTADFDADIKICDANCNIVAGVDGYCDAGPNQYLPNMFQWTCPAAGTYYVVIAPYPSYYQHLCTGTDHNHFTLEYSACSGPYPANDSCDQLPAYYGGSIPTLTAGVPRTYYGDNRCAELDCPMWFPWPEVWEAFTVTGSPTGWDITLDYCGNQGFWSCYTGLVTGCPCADYIPDSTHDHSCPDGHVAITWQNLPDGTYYYPVMLDPEYDSVGPYTLHVVATPVASGACCFVGSLCSSLTSAQCAASGGVYQGDGTSCSPNPCICPGDVNCDGQLDFADINPFVLYLSNHATYLATYPNCDPRNGDINGDGTYGQESFGDINPFVALFTGEPPIPCTY